ncbi:MAG: purine-nucleoside phosphorylase [Candidatus Dormibacteraceae bacterium]
MKGKMLASLSMQLLVLAGCLGSLASCAFSTPVRQSSHFPVRVLVLTMFNPETAPWLAHEHLTTSFNVPGAFAPVRCDSSGLCVTTLGEGKSNAGASMTAILLDHQLDLGHAFFLTAGIAGTPPSVGTLGFAAWAHWVVDWDLGNHLLPETAPDVPHGYLPTYDEHTSAYHLNEKLSTLAMTVTKNVTLSDSPEAMTARKHYPGQASQHPFITQCDTISGDDFWAGSELSEEAQYITDLRTNHAARYCTTAEEDTAIATALNRAGYLDKYLVLRTASDFDQPYPGQTMRALLATFPGFGPAIENEYRVGSTMAHYLIDHPEEAASSK